MLFDDTFLHDAANESDQVRVVLFLDVARKDALAAGAAEPVVFVDRAPDRVGASDPPERDHQSRLMTGHRSGDFLDAGAWRPTKISIATCM